MWLKKSDITISDSVVNCKQKEVAYSHFFLYLLSVYIYVNQIQIFV